MKAKTSILGGCALLLSAAALPAFAHHSYAMFDVDRDITVEGTVTQFLWTNPHSWMRIMVPKGQGAGDEWAVEMGPVGIMAHLGWNPKTVMRGDKVSITLHPLKDGTPGGDFVAINSGARNKVTNDGGSQARLKARAAHRGENVPGPSD